jgi:hypothetical protein
MKPEQSPVLSLVRRRGPDEVLAPQAAPSPSDRYTVLLLDDAQLDRLLERQGVRAATPSEVGSVRERDAIVAAPAPSWGSWSRMAAGLLAVAVAGLAAGLALWMWTRPTPPAAPAAASTPAVAPPDLAPVVATGASFSIDASTFLDDMAADTAAARLLATGWPAFTWRLEEGKRHLLVGPYASIEEAESSQRLLGQSGFPATRLHVDDRLRVTLLASPAVTEPPRYPAVRLVAAPGRLSYVIELADEPRSVSGQRVSAASFLVLAAPLATPVENQVWKAPGDVRLVSRIAVSPHLRDARTLQAVVTLAETADASVRLEGRRVYVDVYRRVDLVTPVDLEPAPVRSETPARTAAVSRSGERAARGGPATTGADELSAYRVSMQPIVVRFEEIQPFLRSAIASATPDVLGALSGTCAELEQALAAVTPPPAARATHGMFLSAAQLARAAASPSYAGDRVGQVREAAAQFAAAKARLAALADLAAR